MITDTPGLEQGGVSAEFLEWRPYCIMGGAKRPNISAAQPDPGPWVNPKKFATSRKARRAARVAGDSPTSARRVLNIIKREQDALKVGEVALQIAQEHLELEQVAQAMLEVEHVEAYRAARRAVHTTQLNASRQLNYAYGMQTKIEQGEDKKKAQEEKAQLDKEELAKVGPYIAWAARNIAANAVANIVRNARESDRVKLAAEKRKAFLATFM